MSLFEFTDYCNQLRTIFATKTIDSYYLGGLITQFHSRCNVDQWDLFCQLLSTLKK